MGICGKCNREVKTTKGGKVIPDGVKCICNECLDSALSELGFT